MGLLNLVWRSAPADIDEARYNLPDPFVGALNVAAAKARAVRLSGAEVIIAADTLVVADGEVLGKPADADHARTVLRRLRGRAHDVLTGVALRTGQGRYWGGVVSTRVRMRAYVDRDIEDYVRRGEPFDKAGGYAIQDTEFRPVESVEGCYLNVVGLPLCAVASGLKALGLDITPLPDTIATCRYCGVGAELVSVGSRR